jgi:hypothetical protein
MTVREHRETLVRHLVERRGFTEAGARKAVAAYIETMAEAHRDQSTHRAERTSTVRFADPSAAVASIADHRPSVARDVTGQDRSWSQFNLTTPRHSPSWTSA